MYSYTKGKLYNVQTYQNIFEIGSHSYEKCMRNDFFIPESLRQVQLS